MNEVKNLNLKYLCTKMFKNRLIWWFDKINLILS